MSDRRLSALLVAGFSAAVSLFVLWPIWRSRRRSSHSKEAPQKSSSGNSEDVPTEESSNNHPSIVSELWIKIVSATRDITQPDNLNKINFDQWNLALDKHSVVCEPGLSRSVFQSLSPSSKNKKKAKHIGRRDFVERIEAILEDTETYEHHVQMEPQQLLEIHQSADSQLFPTVLLSKILFALLNDQQLNVEALLKQNLCVNHDMNAQDLLSKLDESDWEDRVTILKHVLASLQSNRLRLSRREETDSDESTSSSCPSREISPMCLLRGWMHQFSDQRSQLVRYVLETFPVVMGCVLESGCLDAIDFRSVFEELFIPIRAKRSVNIQEWAHACSEKLIRVMLQTFGNDSSPRDFHRFLDDDTEEENQIMLVSRDSVGMVAWRSHVAELVDIFCAHVESNSKYERVRERCVCYLKLVIEFYQENGDMEFLLDDEFVVSRIVETLNRALLDKKSEVRTQAFALMKRLGDMDLSIVNECLLSKIDAKARARYDRSNGSSTKKRRPLRRKSGASIAQYRRRMQAAKKSSEESDRKAVVA